MAFYETQFPPDISYGAQGGPGFMTDVVEKDSGFESRTQIWSISRSNWNVAHGVKTQDEYNNLLRFFRLMKGKTHGFRFKDWADYSATSSEGLLGATGRGTGYPSYQLYKNYALAVGSEQRLIAKPVSGTLTAYRNGSVVSAGVSSGNWTLSTVTGVLSFVADVIRSISSISRANPGVAITTAAHTFANSQLIHISGVVGMTQVNSRVFTIAGATTSSFQLGVDTSAYSAYTSGGTAQRFAQTSESITAAFEFDVPVRFDTDNLRGTIIAPGLQHDWREIPIIEIRV